MKVAFNLGSIPVRIHGSFLMTAIILGMGGGGNAADQGLLLVTWVVLVVVAVLLHELGHALVGMAFGLKPVIDLMGMGGLTSWPHGKRLSNAKSVAVSLAGPLAGIACGYAVKLLVHPAPGSFGVTVVFLWTQVTIWWGVLNLLPIMPMDGGNVLFATLNALTKGRGERPARIVSIVVGAVAGLLALKVGLYLAAILAGLFVFQNYQALGALGSAKDDVPLREELKLAYAALEKSDATTAARHARAVVEQARDPRLRTDGVRLLAFALVLGGAWGPLMQLLEGGGALMIADDELAKFERAATELGRPDEAARIAALRVQGARVGVPAAVKF